VVSWTHNLYTSESTAHAPAHTNYRHTRFAVRMAPERYHISGTELFPPSPSLPSAGAGIWGVTSRNCFGYYFAGVSFSAFWNKTCRWILSAVRVLMSETFENSCDWHVFVMDNMDG